MRLLIGDYMISNYNYYNYYKIIVIIVITLIHYLQDFYEVVAKREGVIKPL